MRSGREEVTSDLCLGRERLGDQGAATTLEWLITNGIGGFAAGTVSGALTRRAHGLLIAALEPPLSRQLLLAKVAERIELDGAWIDLDTNVWASGAIEPRGHLHLESFRLEESVPVWTWAIGDTRLEKRVWMEQGENTTYVAYRLRSAPAPVTLGLSVLIDHRDAQALTRHGAWQPRIEPAALGLRIEAFEGATPLWLTAPGAEVRPAHIWYHDFALRLEAERGLESTEDHLMAGELTVRLAPRDSFTLVASTRREAGIGGALPLAAARTRRAAHDRMLIEAWKRAQPVVSRSAPAWIRRLVLAADAFIVERSVPELIGGRTVIAGYPWFSDWGRDTMIALPGLALATGRPELARAILATFARYEDRGLLPNCFPDHGEPPGYHTVDATLWFFQAVRAYHEATADDGFLAEVYPTLENMGAWYERGTRYGIAVDPQDGLVRAGEEGLPLTWMDARVEGQAVTLRRGKPVEINALWYNALVTMSAFARRLRRPPEAYDEMARRVENSFERFWNDDLECLYDVIDGPSGPDSAIRSNQLFAVSLPRSPLPAARRRAVVECCGRWLVTSHGLRSLAPNDPRYHGRYTGEPRARDGAYHQGTAWTWLLPHFALAHFRVHHDGDAALAFLAPLENLLAAMAIGTLPELAEGDPPHLPKGCPAQAWSVGEALRVYHLLATSPRAGARTTLARRSASAQAAG